MIRKVTEPCVYILYIWALGQGMRYSNVTASFLPQPTPIAEAISTYRLVTPLLNTAFRQSVPSQILLSPVGLLHHTKTNTALFLAQWSLKLVHAASLSSTRRTSAFWGNLSPL